ncbi:MAG: hypothetical protein WBV39_14725 [Rudaea sp.]
MTIADADGGDCRIAAGDREASGIAVLIDDWLCAGGVGNSCTFHSQMPIAIATRTVMNTRERRGGMNQTVAGDLRAA